MDTGDQVIIINAGKSASRVKNIKIKNTSIIRDFTAGAGWCSFEELIATQAGEGVTVGDYRMIPSGALGNKIKTKLWIYAGDKHPHQAQKPIPLAI